MKGVDVTRRTVDELLGIARGVFARVDIDAKTPDSILTKQELNELLHELLSYYSVVEGDEETYLRLKAVREGRKDWHLHWLNDEGWISHLFFLDWMLGQKALALAENDLAGFPEAFDDDVRRAIGDCPCGVAGDSVFDAIEKLLDAHNENGGTDGATQSDVPVVSAVLQTIWMYAHESGRDDLCLRIRAVAEQIDTDVGRSNVDKKTARRFLSVANHFKNDPLFGRFFVWLSKLNGCYDSRKGEVHDNAMPQGFERNLVLLGRCAADARYAANERLSRAAFEIGSSAHVQQRALLSCAKNEEICGNLKAFEVDGRVSQRIGEIAGREMLDKLLTKMLQRSLKNANASGMGQARPIRIVGRCLRDGSRIREDELNGFLYSIALDILCYLKGWKPWVGDSDNDLTQAIIQEIGGTCDEMNVPVLRFLYGGNKGENLIEFLFGLSHAVLGSKTSKSATPPIHISLNTPTGEDDNGGERTLEDGLASGDAGISDQPDSIWTVEHDDEKSTAVAFAKRLMMALRRFDRKMADHFWLASFGLSGFTNRKGYSTADELWQAQRGKNTIDAKQIRVLLGIGAGNTNWYPRKAAEFASEMAAGRYDDIFNKGECVAISRFFSSRDKEVGK